jgi:hypothetical protein
MKIKDIEKWRQDFETWKEFADYLGYSVRHLEKIRAKKCKIPARIELLWVKKKST